MKQVLQDWMSGEITTAEFPAPALAHRSGVLVRNHCSLISAGTERSSVSFAQSSLLDKARAKPDEVRTLVKDVREQGFWSVYERVRRKVDVPVARGYACAGEVIAVSADVDDLRPGDRVACGGQGAFHAGVVSVKQNLCAKIPESVSYDEAVYTTLGAIAMQGVRMGAPEVGETAIVIGLGLVGQLAAQMLKAAGCSVIGIDLSEFNCAAARAAGIAVALQRGDAGLDVRVKAMTNGFGADLVVICAATESNDPIELAASLCRPRGRVVLVGVSKIDIPRQVFYDKELSFTVSRSYGPGRYDASYEEHGVDYPIGYVRWTERRNMQSFLDLAGRKSISLAALTTHRFPIDDAGKAYALLQSSEPSIGIVIEYPDDRATALVVEPQRTPVAAKAANIGFIGAGSFAQTHLLPHLKSRGDVALITVCNAHGSTAEAAKRQFGFGAICTDPQRIIDDPAINTVFIATRHNTHAPLVAAARAAGKHVFVEKPLATTADGLAEITAAHGTSPGSIMVGFNRRFSPALTELKSFFNLAGVPLSIAYRVNAGFVSKSHWSQDEEEGAGRIIGEVCHFIDTIQFLTNAAPVSVYARSLGNVAATQTAADTVSITLGMSDGSVGTILYLANGDRSLPKEHLFVSGGDCSAAMNNFQSVEFRRQGKAWTKKLGAIDKGQRAEVNAFIDAIVTGTDAPIAFASLAATTRATFAIRESLATGESMKLEG